MEEAVRREDTHMCQREITKPCFLTLCKLATHVTGSERKSEGIQPCAGISRE